MEGNANIYVATPTITADWSAVPEIVEQSSLFFVTATIGGDWVQAVMNLALQMRVNGSGSWYTLGRIVTPSSSPAEKSLAFDLSSTVDVLPELHGNDQLTLRWIVYTGNTSQLDATSTTSPAFTFNDDEDGMKTAIANSGETIAAGNGWVDLAEAVVAGRGDSVCFELDNTVVVTANFEVALGGRAGDGTDVFEIRSSKELRHCVASNGTLNNGSYFVTANTKVTFIVDLPSSLYSVVIRVRHDSTVSKDVAVSGTIS